MLFLIVLKILSVIYSGFAVAHLPIEPPFMIKNLITYQLRAEVVEGQCPISATFLFMFVFFTCKFLLRTKQSTAIHEPMGMTIPGNALASIKSSMGW
jgi:hypothetical protein